MLLFFQLASSSECLLHVCAYASTLPGRKCALGSSNRGTNPSCPHSHAEAAPNTAWDGHRQEEKLGRCFLLWAWVPSSPQDTLLTLPGETWHSAVPQGWEKGRLLHPCRQQQQLQAWGRARSQFTARYHTLCDCEFLFLT